MRFTYNAYEELIGSIRDSGYSFSGYYDWQKSERCCVLRHDVDIDMEKAAEFASFEENLLNGEGVRATYFVLMNTDFYNLYSSTNRRRLAVILNGGHEIGLHFDEMQYDLNGDIGLIVEKIQEETDSLSRIVGKPVTTVSMHRPSKELLSANVVIPGVINSYGSTFFNDFKYMSDSRMFWREDVFAQVTSKKHEKLHILTHPIWYEKNESTLPERLKRFIYSANVQRYDLLNGNFRDLDSEVKRADVLKGLVNGEIND